MAQFEKFEQIDAGTLFIDLTSNELEAVKLNYQCWAESMFDCVQLDCLEDVNLFGYRVMSILSRYDFVMAMFDIITDINYKPNDLMLSANNLVLIMSDLIFVLNCQLDITLDIAQDMDNDDPTEWYVAYEQGSYALSKLKDMFME